MKTFFVCVSLALFAFGCSSDKNKEGAAKGATKTAATKTAAATKTPTATKTPAGATKTQ